MINLGHIVWRNSIAIGYLGGRPMLMPLGIGLSGGKNLPLRHSYNELDQAADPWDGEATDEKSTASMPPSKESCHFATDCATEFRFRVPRVIPILRRGPRPGGGGLSS